MTHSLDDALKPCPFCGSPAHLIEGHRDHWRAQCSKCGANIGEWFANRRPGEDQRLATAAWNTRAALEAAGVAELREENERLREALAVDETPTGGLHLPKWQVDARAASAILAADPPLSRAGRDYAGKVLGSLYDKVKNARAALTNQGKAQG